MSTPSFGKHYVVDLFDCDPELLKWTEPVREIFLRASRDCGATIVNDVFHQYQPHGVSGVVLIAESHLSIHSWPENAFAGVDIYTCGDEMNPELAIEIMEQEFRAGEVQVEMLARGRLRPRAAAAGRRGA